MELITFIKMNTINLKTMNKFLEYSMKFLMYTIFRKNN